MDYLNDKLIYVLKTISFSWRRTWRFSATDGNDSETVQFNLASPQPVAVEIVGCTLSTVLGTGRIKELEIQNSLATTDGKEIDPT